MLCFNASNQQHTLAFITIQFTNESSWIFKSLVGQPSPVKSSPSTPVRGAVNRDASMVQEDILKFYKDNGLEPLAREVRIVKIPPRAFAAVFLTVHRLMHEQYKAYLNSSTVASNVVIHNSWWYFPKPSVSYRYDLFSPLSSNINDCMYKAHRMWPRSIYLHTTPRKH